ncbi:MAG: hypothetical protein ACFFAQ_07110 [Promethearchaeota archaeon]
MKISKFNKKNRKDIEKSTIKILKEKLSNNIQKEIDKGLDPLSAYEQVLKRYELEQEIIIIYENEAEKAGSTKNLDLKFEEIKFLKDKLKEDLFNKFLQEI